MKKTKGLFPEKYLWKGEVCSETVNYAHISGYAGLRRPTGKRLKATRDEKTALSLFLRRKECWKTTIIYNFITRFHFRSAGTKTIPFSVRRVYNITFK
ncbi:MAG: hypothetical protein ACUZ8N_14845 [Candidatus Scalindua sp.]